MRVNRGEHVDLDVVVKSAAEGAIISGSDESASAKKEILRTCSVTTVDSPADIGKTVKDVLS